MESLGDVNEGFRYYKLYHAFEDTLNNIARNRDMLAMQIRFESEKKTQQINLLSQENELARYKIWLNNILLGFLIGIVVIIALIAILLIRQNRLKTLQQTNKLKQRLFRSQLNPHFIFNSIASIQNAIINEEAVDASRYLARFSKLVRNILDSTVSDVISLEEEISTIENFLALQKLRYEEAFDYKMVVDEYLDQESIFIPPMLTQPFIENAIEHGIRNKEQAGNISVGITKNEDYLCIEIIDDGVGRQAANAILKKQKKNHKSLSTGIIQERIKIFNKKSKNKISLEIIDLTDDSGAACGTKVILKIPLDFPQH
jgi:LytS/YehU family sensor histidine kinase